MTLFALAALGLAGPSRAQCPPSTLRFPALGPLDTLDPVFEVHSTDGSWIIGEHQGAEFSLHHSGYLAPTVITARDRYDVVGVDAGTQVPVLFRLIVSGWAYTGGCGGTGCCGILTATVRAGADTAQIGLVGHTFGGTAPFAGQVSVPITLVAGTPRDLEIEMYARRCAGGSHTVDAKGVIVFEGTNPEAYVVSCKGFGPVVVPARRSSWGRLKTLYR